MALVLHDTLSGKKKPFRPLDASTARIYVCGPTVYDHMHLGHARCYVVYDVLVRHLRASGQSLTYVRNITDVNEKILERSRENGESPESLTARMTASFHEDLRALRTLPPDIEPKVSDHLPEIVSLIERLISEGAAYASGGDVYFRVRSYEGYGRLSKRPLEDLVTGASGRTEESETRKKEDPADFALWKGCEESEWGWSSPWGHGRPGWHIECSAMSMKHLGVTLDLHGGGLDLVFPHHENELAQSEAATHSPFCNHWMHNGFVEVNSVKMSKSLGNFFSAKQLFEHCEPEAVRFAMLGVHYRSPLSIEWVEEEGQLASFPLLEEAEKRLEYVYETQRRLSSIDPSRIVEDGDVSEALSTFPARLGAALDDDLNTAVALALLSELLRELNELVDQSRRKKGTASSAAIQAAVAALRALESELGIGGDQWSGFLSRIRQRRAKKRGISENEVERLIVARKDARTAKNFGEADRIRDRLVELGVELMDSPSGTDWRIPA